MAVARDLIEKIEHPDGSVHYIRTDTGVKVCGSPLRKKPDNCGNPHGISPWNGRCRLHGKDSPGAKIITGARSKVRKRPDALLGDRALLDMRRPIAVLAHACEGSMKRLDSLDTPAFRRKAMRLLDKYHDAEDDGARTTAVAHLEDWIIRGGDKDAAFRDFVNAAKDLLHGQERGCRIALDGRHSLSQPDLVGVFSRFLDGLHVTYGLDGARPMEKWMAENILLANHWVGDGS